MVWLIPLLFLLILARVPIAFSLGFVSIVGIYLTSPGLLVNVPRQIFGGIESFTLVAVPLFVLAGELMTKGGISARIVRFAQTSVGFLPGGLAMVVVVASLFFAALTGTAIAAAAAVGGMLLPSMKKEGYDVRFSSSLVATSSTIGPIVPPSVVLILFGVIAGVSIGDLFLAGIVPGVLMALGLMAYSYYVGTKEGYRAREGLPSIMEFLSALKDAVLALLMPVIIVGGIVSGIFTATESGVVAVVYAVCIGMLVFRELKPKDLIDAVLSTAKTTASIVFLIGTATLFIWLLSFHQIPDRLADVLGPLATNTVLLLLTVNLVLLLAGTFIDTISAVTIFTPIFLPLVMAANIDPIHFGIILAVNLTIGMVTPPLGVCLFVAAEIANIKVPEMFRFLFPQVGILLLVLLLITYIPQITLLPLRLFTD